MENLQKILKEFGDLPSLVRFLNEKINDGQEISRGKNPLDKSKEQKVNEAPPKPPGPQGGGEGGEGGEATPPVIDPSQAPGSQITIGNKQPDPEFDMYTNEIKISGKKDIVNTRPRANINYNNGTF